MRVDDTNLDANFVDCDYCHGLKVDPDTRSYRCPICDGEGYVVLEQEEVIDNGDGEGRMRMAQHRLKTWPEYFEGVAGGSKTFEVRKNDRDFRIGDTLVLREFGTETRLVEDEKGNLVRRAFDAYTGRECRRTVTYILHGGQFGIEDALKMVSTDKSWMERGERGCSTESTISAKEKS